MVTEVILLTLDFIEICCTDINQLSKASYCNKCVFYIPLLEKRIPSTTTKNPPRDSTMSFRFVNRSGFAVLHFIRETLLHYHATTKLIRRCLQNKNVAYVVENILFFYGVEI